MTSGRGGIILSRRHLTHFSIYTHGLLTRLTQDGGNTSRHTLKDWFEAGRFRGGAILSLTGGQGAISVLILFRSIYIPRRDQVPFVQATRGWTHKVLSHDRLLPGTHHFPGDSTIMAEGVSPRLFRMQEANHLPSRCRRPLLSLRSGSRQCWGDFFSIATT